MNYELVSLVVLWTWFNSGLVGLSPSLDGELKGDVLPTSAKSLGANHGPACPLPNPFLLSILLSRLCHPILGRVFNACLPPIRVRNEVSLGLGGVWGPSKCGKVV